MTVPLAEAMRAQELFLRLYKRHSAGCCLHVVLDDGNADDEVVRWTLVNVGGDACKDPAECRELAEILLRMSKTQRLKLGRGYEAAYRDWQLRKGASKEPC